MGAAPNKCTNTALVRKLRFAAGMRVHVAHAPVHVAALAGDLPEGVRVLRRRPARSAV